ncbi:MAG: hypothetical protein SOZ59_14280 [Candidatus Limivivens sp.]|nr:hypothetical protein [Candidatus Limivivens sp.]
MSLKERVSQLLRGEGENDIFPFFWMHGEEEGVLREYMQKIQEANIGAVCVESRPHPDFAGSGWWADLDVILDEAKKRKMKVWILDDQHFPTGYAAGAMEHADRELCHQYLDYSVLESWGPRPRMEINVEAYAKPQPLPPWMPPMPGEPKRKHHDDRLFRVLACPVKEKGEVGEPLDLTGEVQSGKLIWDIPEGYWKIYVIYLTRDARGRNNYINFLDPDSCRILIDAVYEPHYQRYRELFGSVIAGFFSDEPPIGNTPGYTRGDLIGKPDMSLPWSKEMQAAMNREYGTGWERFLPYLWNQGTDRQQMARIRTAYMNAVSKLVSRCFSDQLGRWCEAHGVEYIGHMLEDCDSSANLGPSMGHFFRGLSGQHMAGIDNIGGQVLPGGMDVHRQEPDSCQDSAGFYHYMLGRMGASAAAIDPKKKGRCMCENFGAYGWRAGVRLEKYLMDHFLARGVNRFVPHAFSPKAFPDPDCPPHFYAHGENPQFKAFGALMAYTNRICNLIDGGTGDAPVAVLYHGESQWAGSYESNISVCRQLTRNQISFLILPADALEKEKITNPDKGAGRNERSDQYERAIRYEENHAVFVPGKPCFRINGTECRVLVISRCRYLTRAAAEFALEAAEKGIPVLFTGWLPEGISDTDAKESARLTAKLEEKFSEENHSVVPTEKLAEELSGPGSLENAGADCRRFDVLKSDRTDFREVVTEQPWPNLTVYHYRNGGEVWLLLNEDPGRSFEQWVTLPAVGTVCVYDAWENRLRPAKVHREKGAVRVFVQLAPLEMQVLLCGLSETDSHIPAEKIGREAEETVCREIEGEAEGEACRNTAGKELPGETGRQLELGDWTVSRCEAKAYPHFSDAEPADLEAGMAGLHPEFSGYYRYETGIVLQDWRSAWLEIADAYEAAEVFINGISAGLRIAPPYRYEINGLLQNGENHIAIEVATTLERKAAAIGAGDGGMGTPAPMAPTGIVGRITLKRKEAE